MSEILLDLSIKSNDQSKNDYLNLNLEQLKNALNIDSSIQAAVENSFAQLFDAFSKYNDSMAAQAHTSLQALVQECLRYCELNEEYDLSETSAYIEKHRHLIDDSWTMQETITYLDQFHEDEKYWDEFINNSDNAFVTIITILAQNDLIDLSNEFIMLIWMLLLVSCLAKNK